MKEIKKYSARLSNLDRLAADIEDFCRRHSVGDSDRFDITLCADEIFTNIVTYGYNEDSSETVEVLLEKRGDSLTVTMRDNAPKFDPIEESAAPDLCNPIEQRCVGGLGVHFLKKKMDELKYERKNGVNELFMRKRLGKVRT